MQNLCVEYGGCDTQANTFCSFPANKDNPFCTCINRNDVYSLIPLCYDQKCAATGYKTANMRSTDTCVPLQISQCNEYMALGNNIDASTLDNLKQQCGIVATNNITNQGANPNLPDVLSTSGNTLPPGELTTPPVAPPPNVVYVPDETTGAMVPVQIEQPIVMPGDTSIPPYTPPYNPSTPPYNPSVPPSTPPAEPATSNSYIAFIFIFLVFLAVIAVMFKYKSAPTAYTPELIPAPVPTGI